MQIKTKIVSSHTVDSKPVKQEVNGTVILPPELFPAKTFSIMSFIIRLSVNNTQQIIEHDNTTYRKVECSVTISISFLHFKVFKIK